MSLAIRVGWSVVAVVLAYLRLHGTMDNRFQAIAHIVVGGWWGAWFLGMTIRHQYEIVDKRSNCVMDIGAQFYGWTALAVSLVEVFAFLNGIGKVDGR